MLFIFSGLPGTGKTTLARAFAQRIRAVHVRVDTIEQALREFGLLQIGSEGYELGHRVAADNLRVGVSVIADCVNPLRLTRDAWRTVAQRCRVDYREIEVTCTDLAEHRLRSTRASRMCRA